MAYFLQPNQASEASSYTLWAHLIPKLRCQFAEFLNQSSSTRLSIFYPPTCVGLRYEQLLISLEAFLGTGVSTILLAVRRL